MPRIVSWTLTAVLLLLAIAGWAMWANLAFSVIPKGPGAPDAVIADTAVLFARTHVEAQAGTQSFDQVALLATGPEAKTVAAEIAAKPAPVTTLAWKSGTASMLWRDGPSAAVEVSYTVSLGGTDAAITEHYAMAIDGGEWKVSVVWRIADPGAAPLVPVPGTEPTPAAPTPEPTPAPTPAPSLDPAFPAALVMGGSVLVAGGTTPDGLVIGIFTTTADPASTASFFTAAAKSLGRTATSSTGADGVVTLSFGTDSTAIITPAGGGAKIYIQYRP
jgi:hypothetical protein